MNKRFTKKETKLLIGKVQELLDYNELIIGLVGLHKIKTIAEMRQNSKLYRAILAKLQVDHE